MKKVSINEAAEILGISKEAVYNRIRRGTLEICEENGQKFVVIDEEFIPKFSQNEPKQNSTKFSQNSKFSQNQNFTKIQNFDQNSVFLNYLINEVSELKAQIIELQSQKEELYKQKEEILVQSKDEIKRMYKERDEKLQYFLSLFEKPLLEKPAQKPEHIDINEAGEVKFRKNFEQKQNYEPKHEWISLKKFLKYLNLKEKKSKKIKNLIIKNIGNSEFIKVENDILFLRTDINLQNLKNQN